MGDLTEEEEKHQWLRCRECRMGLQPAQWCDVLGWVVWVGSSLLFLSMSLPVVRGRWAAKGSWCFATWREQPENV